MSTENKPADPGTQGYVGFANLPLPPNQVYRKSVKKGFEFPLMIVGESGLEKSTLINSLFLKGLYADGKIPDAEDKAHKTVNTNAKTVEIEERGGKLRLTLVDTTPGFGDAMNKENSFLPLVRYIDGQFEKFLRGERGFNRGNISETRVHCCFYSPFGHGIYPWRVVEIENPEYSDSVKTPNNADHPQSGFTGGATGSSL